MSLLERYSMYWGKLLISKQHSVQGKTLSERLIRNGTSRAGWRAAWENRACLNVSGCWQPLGIYSDGTSHIRPWTKYAAYAMIYIELYLCKTYTHAHFRQRVYVAYLVFTLSNREICKYLYKLHILWSHTLLVLEPTQVKCMRPCLLWGVIRIWQVVREHSITSSLPFWIS